MEKIVRIAQAKDIVERRIRCDQCGRHIEWKPYCNTAKNTVFWAGQCDKCGYRTQIAAPQTVVLTLDHPGTSTVAIERPQTPQ